MTFRSLLLTSAALAAIATPALADTTSIEKRLDAMQKMIEAQQAQIETQKAEIAALKKGTPAKKGKAASNTVSPPPPAEPSPQPVAPAVETKLAAQQSQIDALIQQVETNENAARLAKQEAPVWSMPGGRPTITSADGRFSLAIRSLVQYDLAHYMQPKTAQTLTTGADLSSGGNFRRAWFGVQGKMFGDWSYYFNYDFGGGGGTETPGHIQQLWIQYDGLGPFALRIGAFTPSNGIEDATSSGDTIFLERNAPSEMARNVAGGDGRNTISLTYSDPTLFGQVTYTGNKIQDSGSFDEQQAITARAAGLPYSSEDLKLLLSAAGSYVFKVADAAAGQGAARTITLNAPPEITVDNTGTKFVTSGALNAERVWQYGLEAAAEYQNFYAQGGYFRYGVDLRANAGAYAFSGWYSQATWLLTGESRPYSAASASFGNPKPRVPFSLSGGGWGAWELAARFSDLNVNDKAGVIGAVLPAGGIRGGDQKIWTLGVNWYPVSALKFELQYQNVDISRIGTKGTVTNTQIGQTFNVLALRSAIQL